MDQNAVKNILTACERYASAATNLEAVMNDRSTWETPAAVDAIVEFIEAKRGWKGSLDTQGAL